MGMNECIGKNICLELKTGSKYFGILKEIDESPKEFSWIILEIKGKTETFADNEILRIEVIE